MNDCDHVSKHVRGYSKGTLWYGLNGYVLFLLQSGTKCIGDGSVKYFHCMAPKLYCNSSSFSLSDECFQNTEINRELKISSSLNLTLSYSLALNGRGYSK